MVGDGAARCGESGGGVWRREGTGGPRILPKSTHSPRHCSLRVAAPQGKPAALLQLSRRAAAGTVWAPAGLRWVGLEQQLLVLLGAAAGSAARLLRFLLSATMAGTTLPWPPLHQVLLVLMALLLQPLQRKLRLKQQPQKVMLLQLLQPPLRLLKRQRPPKPRPAVTCPSSSSTSTARSRRTPRSATLRG